MTESFSVPSKSTNLQPPRTRFELERIVAVERPVGDGGERQDSVPPAQIPPCGRASRRRKTDVAGQEVANDVDRAKKP